MTSINDLPSRSEHDDLLDHIISSYNPRLTSSLLSNLSEYLKYKLNFDLSNETIEFFISDVFKRYSSVHIFPFSLYSDCIYNRKVISTQKKYPNITEELQAKDCLIFFLSNSEVALVLNHIEALKSRKPYLYLINAGDEEQLEKELFVKKLLASQYNLFKLEFNTQTIKLQGAEPSSILLACALRGLSQSDFLDIKNIQNIMSFLQPQDLEVTQAEILELLRSKIQLEDEELNNILEYSIQKFRKIQSKLTLSTDIQNDIVLDSLGSGTLTRTEGTESIGTSLSVYEMELPSNSSNIQTLVTSRKISAKTHRCMMTPRKCKPKKSKARKEKARSIDTKEKWEIKDDWKNFESVENEVHPEFSFGGKPDYQENEEIIEKTYESPLIIPSTDQTDTEITEFITSPTAYPTSEFIFEPKHFIPSIIQPVIILTYYPILKPKISLNKFFKADLYESSPTKHFKRPETLDTYKNSIFSDLSYSSIDVGQEIVRVQSIESEEKFRSLEYTDSNPRTSTSIISVIRALNTKPEGRTSMIRKSSDNDWEERRYGDPLLKTRLKLNFNQDKEEEEVDQEGTIKSVEDPIHITKMYAMYEEDQFQKSTQYLHSKIDKLKEKIKSLRKSDISEEISLSTERNRELDINSQNLKDVMENYLGHLPERVSANICEESKTATLEAHQYELIPSIYKDLISSRNLIHETIVNIENIESENLRKEGIFEASSKTKIKLEEVKSCQCSTCSLL